MSPLSSTEPGLVPFPTPVSQWGTNRLIRNPSLSLGGKHWALHAWAPPSQSGLCSCLQHGHRPGAPLLQKDKATPLLALCGSTRKEKQSKRAYSYLSTLQTPLQQGSQSRSRFMHLQISYPRAQTEILRRSATQPELEASSPSYFWRINWVRHSCNEYLLSPCSVPSPVWQSNQAQQIPLFTWNFFKFSFTLHFKCIVSFSCLYERALFFKITIIIPFQKADS